MVERNLFNGFTEFFTQRRTASLLVASALLTAPVCFAAGDEAASADETRGPRIWERVSERFDADKNGEVSAEEIGDATRFAHMDRNGDQVITSADFEGLPERGMRGRRGPRGGGLQLAMQAADTDQDGKIAVAEWSAFVAQIDADGDGILSEEERSAFRQEQQKAAGVEGAEGHGRGGHMSKMMDTDGDGEVQVQEVAGVFTKLDRNGDGFLSSEDRPERRGFRGRGHGARRIGGHLMKLADINQDQQLTREEWDGYLATLDSNTDGLLSRDELSATRPADAPEPREIEGQERPALEVSRLSEAFSRRDQNGDGVIAEDEWARRGHGKRGGFGPASGAASGS